MMSTYYFSPDVNLTRSWLHLDIFADGEDSPSGRFDVARL